MGSFREEPVKSGGSQTGYDASAYREVVQHAALIGLGKSFIVENKDSQLQRRAADHIQSIVHPGYWDEFNWRSTNDKLSPIS